MNMLRGEAIKWRELGTEFGFQCHELDEIEMSRPQGGPKDWLLTLISRKKARADKFTWGIIVEALCSINSKKTAEIICNLTLSQSPSGQWRPTYMYYHI